ncbi:sodium:solute symporter family protein [Geodermatophilus sp. YIM 151500]|uniref:sodium:solute symporter family protein n=1 Tax=Geodermatophilus sp. YIM 151500 TaxID=2984531 RepID=UPI0021E3B20D|nr:sodium:solute symporter family protein [Geodermatophilus sp. YIM 151500]MCV2488866.1 sodium:solute symporter family protein [Geodermatophilus sp. YIM 151500]
MSQSVWLWTFLVVYTVGMIGLGFWTKRWIDDDEDFMVAGRGLSWPLQGMGMTAIIIAGTTGATVGAIGYASGYVAHWWITGWILAVVIGAFTIAPFARRTGGVTMTEWFEANFGKWVRIVAGLALALGLLFSPLANILGGSLILSGLMGITPESAILILGFSGLVYLYLGGMWATVFSDLVQFVLFALAFIGGTLWLVLGSDGTRALSELPSGFFNPLPHGDFAGLSWTAGSAFGLFFLMFCLAFGGTYWHRGAAARSPAEARKGWLLGVALAVPFAVVMPLAGMYIRGQGITLDDPQQAFGVFIAELPPVAAGAMLAGILAATMSTVEVGVVAGVSVLFRDVIERGRGIKFSPAASVRWIRMITVVYGVIAIFGGIFLHGVSPGVGALIGIAFLSAFSAALLPSVFATMLGRRFCSREASLLSIVAATVYTVYSLASGTYVEVHPMFVSAIIATVVYVVVAAIVRMTGPWWGAEERVRQPAASRQPAS